MDYIEIYIALSKCKHCIKRRYCAGSSRGMQCSIYKAEKEVTGDSKIAIMLDVSKNLL